jgi:uroporphyrinogen decarboxylase
MNHRERYLAAIQHKPVDKVPTDMWATIEVQEKLCDYFGIKTGKGSGKMAGIEFNGGGLSRDVDGIVELLDKLDIDGCFNLMPPYLGKIPEPPSGYKYADEWGLLYKPTGHGTGSYDEIFPPPALAAAQTIEDLDAYNWPDPDLFDYDILPGLADRCGDRAIGIGYTAPFFYYNILRGYQQSLEDLLLAPEFAHHFIKKISDVFIQKHRRAYQAIKGKAHLSQVTDDYGDQNGLLISPKTFSKFFEQPQRRSMELAKEYGLYVFHHDDGDIRLLLPKLIDMGINILNPVQWRCGNWDLADLKQKYGDKICFHSAVDNQHTLPFGTPDDVRKEVKWLIETLASNQTGLIIGPCHNLQSNTPVENIIALYDAAREFGDFSTKN